METGPTVHSPRFWFYAPKHAPCSDIDHALPIEDEPCQCGAWSWDRANHFTYDRSAGTGFFARLVARFRGASCEDCGKPTPCGCRAYVP